MKRSSSLSLLLGNVFEHYDSALYGFLSPLFAALFFPESEYLTALIMTYAIIALSMLARPVGSLFFGYIGDGAGRGPALFLSLFGMAFVTAAIGLIPTYHTIGPLAPLLLLLARVLQNFFAAGETIGGAVSYLEGVEEEKKDLASGIYSTSTIAGILLASGAVSFLYHLEIVEQYWRMLYLAGFITALFAGMIRLQTLQDAPVQEPKEPFLTHIKRLWPLRSILIPLILASGFSYACYSTAFVLITGLSPLVCSVTKAEMAKLSTLMLIFDFATLPLFGLLAARLERGRMMQVAALFPLFLGLPLFCLLQDATYATLILIRICLVTIGVSFSAPFHSWSQSFVEKRLRYTAISFSYAIGSQLFGGTTSAISLWLYQKTGLVVLAGGYLAILGLAAAYALFRLEQTKESRAYEL